MDLFDKPEYRLNKMLLSSVGQWPYDGVAKRRIVTFFLVLFISTQCIAQICALFTGSGDVDILLDSLSPLIADLTIMTKLVTYTINAKHVKTLLRYMVSDWNAIKASCEFDILRRYAEQSRKYSYVYTYIFLTVLVMLMMMPVAPRILRIGNLSGERPLPHHVEYFVDNEEYYYPILFHAYVAMTMLLTSLVAADVMLIAFVHHACGMLAIVEYKLAHIIESENMEVDLHPVISKDAPYWKIRECIERHNAVLRYVTVLESLYNIAFFLQAGLNMITISIAGVRVITTVGSPHEFLRQVAFACAQICHLYFESIQGQQLIDHSVRIQESLGKCRWYLMSFRARKLICFILMRSQVVCSLTAGKLLVISMEFCSQIARTSMSYFTVLRTMQ